MAFTVIFYQIDKKQNSTKLPTVADPKVSLDCSLKGPCSILQPVIQITKAGSLNLNAMPTTYNYCYIANWNRYYFVTNWVWSGAILTASLSVDVLASYKTQIGSKSLYVARAASSYNGKIVDTTYPTTTDVTWTQDSQANPFAGKTGCYIVGIINTVAESGAVSYYAMDQAAFAEFCTAMYNTISWMGIDPNEISEELQKALVNPFQYVVSCQYMPINLTDVSGIPGRNPIYTIPFGFWSFTISNPVYKALPDDYTTTGSGYFTIPKHPQAATRGNYLNTAPYSTYILRLYPFGLMNIDSTDLMDASALIYIIYTDICTGRSICNIAVGACDIRTVETQVGVTIPTAAIQMDYTKWSAGLISAGSSLISSATSGGSFGDYLSAKWHDLIGGSTSSMEEWEGQYAGQGASTTSIASSAMAAMSRAEISGQLGMRTGYLTQTIALIGKFLALADEDLAHRGRPLCTTVQLNTLSGFIQVADGDISIAGVTAYEQSMIIAFLTSGFFYE